MKTKIICEMCGEEFLSGWGNKLTCSDKCRTKRLAKITGRLANEKMPSGSVGAMSELFICGDLLKKGYSVFRSVSPNCFCDLIAIKEKQVLKVEVKTGYVHPTTKKLQFGKTGYEVDIYAVYERNSGKIFYLNMDLVELGLLKPTIRQDSNKI